VLVLALDTALHAAAAAVLDGGHPLAAESVAMSTGHAEALLPMVERVLRAGGVEYATLGRVAVTIGPGTFSGVRIALSAARAMGLALRIPVVGVGTLEALAASLPSVDGMVAAVIDARRGQVYFQVFDGARPMAAPALLAIDAAAAAVPAGARLIGNGAPLLRAMRGELVLAGAPPAPDIVTVGRLGGSRSAEAHPPTPLYVRAPDAKPQGAPLARRP
jgi:tRNA threonylcarbamoyl adenosine modification protein YeaZ